MSKHVGINDPEKYDQDDPVDEHRRDALRIGLSGALGLSALAATGQPAAAQSEDNAAFSLNTNSDYVAVSQTKSQSVLGGHMNMPLRTDHTLF